MMPLEPWYISNPTIDFDRAELLITNHMTQMVKRTPPVFTFNYDLSGFRENDIVSCGGKLYILSNRNFTEIFDKVVKVVLSTSKSWRWYDKFRKYTVQSLHENKVRPVVSLHKVQGRSSLLQQIRNKRKKYVQKLRSSFT